MALDEPPETRKLSFLRHGGPALERSVPDLRGRTWLTVGVATLAGGGATIAAMDLFDSQTGVVVVAPALGAGMAATFIALVFREPPALASVAGLAAAAATYVIVPVAVAMVWSVVIAAAYLWYATLLAGCILGHGLELVGVDPPVWLEAACDDVADD
jgi:hypothetical protein